MNSIEKEYFKSFDAPDDWKPWLMKRHREFCTKGKSNSRKKIADFFDANKVKYLFKCPIWIPKDKKAFFVDFYLPEYSLMVDLEANKETKHYDDKENELRILLLSSIKGMGYHIVKRWDLKSDDFRCKISAAMLSRWEKERGMTQ